MLSLESDVVPYQPMYHEESLRSSSVCIPLHGLPMQDRDTMPVFLFWGMDDTENSIFHITIFCIGVISITVSLRFKLYGWCKPWCLTNKVFSGSALDWAFFLAANASTGKVQNVFEVPADGGSRLASNAEKAFHISLSLM